MSHCEFQQFLVKIRGSGRFKIHEIGLARRRFESQPDQSLPEFAPHGAVLTGHLPYMFLVLKGGLGRDHGQEIDIEGFTDFMEYLHQIRMGDTKSHP